MLRYHLGGPFPDSIRPSLIVAWDSMWRQLRQKHLRSQKDSMQRGVVWTVDGVDVLLRFEIGKGFFVGLDPSWSRIRVPGSWHSSGGRYPRVDFVRLQEAVDTLMVQHVTMS